MADLDAMQLADVGAALEEGYAKAGYEPEAPDWEFIVSAAVEGKTLGTVRGDVKNAVEMVRDQYNVDREQPAEPRWLGEMLVRELEHRGFRIVLA